MAVKLHKCPSCKSEIDPEIEVKIGKRYYHPECITDEERDKKERQELLDYIWFELYDKNCSMPMITKQIKEFKEEHNYRYKGMELALRYFYDTLGNSMREGDGIGIIPYMYEKAKKHHMMINNVRESVENTDEKKVKTVEIESPQFTYQRKTTQIDISSL